PIENPNINYIVLALSMVFEGAAWTLAYREFNRTRGRRGLLRAVQESKDPSTFVVLFEDSAAMLGLLVAFAGVWLSRLTGAAWLDGAASVVIGLILGATAFWLAWETKSLLIGESARPGLVEGVRRLARDVPEIERVGDVLTLHMGPEFVLVTLTVDFRDDCPAGRVETAVATLNRAIKAEFPRVKRIFVEAEALGRNSAP
nr:cation transporter [bacterium]